MSMKLARAARVVLLGALGSTCGCSEASDGRRVNSGSAGNGQVVAEPQPGLDSSAGGAPTLPSTTGDAQGVRLHFGHVRVPETVIADLSDAGAQQSEADPFVDQCPTGNDCFFTVSVVAEGRVIFDDFLGRVTAELSEADRTLAESLIVGLESAPACPGLPAGASVHIALSVRGADGGERFYGEVGGCLAGELTSQTDHKLFQLRKFYEGMRWVYAGCPPTDPAALPPPDDLQRRPFCRVGFTPVAPGH